MTSRRASDDVEATAEDKINATFKLLLKEISDSFDRICKVAMWTAEDVHSTLQGLSNDPRKTAPLNPPKRKNYNDLIERMKSRANRENNNQPVSKDGMRVVIVGSQDPDRENNEDEYEADMKSNRKWVKNSDNFDDSFDDFDQKFIRPKPEDAIDTKPNFNRNSPERDDSYEWINVRETPKSPPRKDAYPCDECNFTSSKKFFLDRHIKAVHLKLKDYACSKCKFKTAYKTEIKRHMKNQHNIEVVTNA